MKITCNSTSVLFIQLEHTCIMSLGHSIAMAGKVCFGLHLADSILRVWIKVFEVSSTLFSGVLTIYMGEPEIPVGKSNGSCHSIWEASENMGCDLRLCYFTGLLSLSG